MILEAISIAIFMQTYTRLRDIAISRSEDTSIAAIFSQVSSENRFWQLLACAFTRILSAIRRWILHIYMTCLIHVFINLIQASSRHDHLSE